jgi:hypothetical protein
MNTAIHSSFLKKSLTIATLIPVVAVASYAQETKDSRAATAVTKATNAAEAVLKKLPSIPGAADAKVINIHIGDNYTFGFDEGIDAEEWGMVDNQTEGGQAAAATKQPSTSATPEERPSSYRKLDFRKGDVVLIATEQPVNAPKPAESSTATPEPASAPTATPTPEPVPVAPHEAH